MISVIQMFNGNEQRVVGHARTFAGVVKRVKSVLGAGTGWGVKLRGTSTDLAQVGAYQHEHGWSFEFRVGNPRARKTITIVCEVM